jgi:hypothetical protein
MGGGGRNVPDDTTGGGAGVGVGGGVLEIFLATDSSLLTFGTIHTKRTAVSTYTYIYKLLSKTGYCGMEGG